MAGAFQSDAFQGDAFQAESDSPNAGLAGGTGASFAPTVSITGSASAGHAAATGTASAASVSLGTSALAGHAAGTGAAPSATTAQTLALPPGVRTLSGTVPAFALSLPPGVITRTGRTVVSATTTGGAPFTFAGTVLFRGQVTGVRAEGLDDLLILTIEATDYNRLWPLYKVGVPHPDNFVIIPWLDPRTGETYGTKVYWDEGAYNFGDGPGDSGTFRYLVKEFMPQAYLGYDHQTHVHNTNPDYSHIPVLRWQLTDVKSVLDDHVARQGPYTAYWIRSATREYVYTALAPVGVESEFIEPAPWEINDDGAVESGNVIKPLRMTAGTDKSRPKDRVFVRGGTPPAQLWVEADPLPFLNGEEYVDAPGAQSAEEATTIGEWHLANNFRRMVSGSATIPARHDGWRVGQTGRFTSARLTKYTDVVLADTPAIITQVKGRMVGPGGLTVTIDGVNGIADLDISAFVTKYQSLDFEEIGFGQPGKATIVVEVFIGDAMIGNSDTEIDIPDLAELIISTDGTAEIEYDLEFGDPLPGSLAMQADRGSPEPVPVYPKPVYHFTAHIQDPDFPVGGTTMVLFQLTDIANNGVQLAGITAELLILQWADEHASIPATEYAIVEAVGETNAFGHIYATLQHLDVAEAEQAVLWEPLALALPVP